MKKEILEIEKYTYEEGKYKFIVYLVPGENNKIKIFVERDDCEFVSFAEVVELNKIIDNKEEYVKEHIKDWIIGWEFDINS